MNKTLLVGGTLFQGRKAGENTTEETEKPDLICPLWTIQVHLKEMVRLCILLLTLTRGCKQQISRFYVIPRGTTY